MVNGAVIAGILLLAVIAGLFVVRDIRRRYIREKPDWRSFVLFYVAAALVVALTWLIGARDVLFLGSTALFVAIIGFGAFVWPPLPRD